MAVSTVPVNDGNFLFMEPKITIINPRAAENINKVLKQYPDDVPVELSLINVKYITNVAARMMVKRLYRSNVNLIHVSPAARQMLNWAANYLYEKGELEYAPHEIFV